MTHNYCYYHNYYPQLHYRYPLRAAPRRHRA